MMYDLFADFYEKSSDSQPKYTVLLGSYYPKTIGEMEELGFQEDKNSTPGYLDYVMEVDEEEVTSFIQDGYESETLDIIYSGIEWEKVLISATEVEVIDDDGHYPPRGVMMGDTFVAFGKSNPDETVIFKRGNPYETKGSVPEFHVTVSRIKHLLGVETLTEAIMKLQAMSEEKNWTYEELKDLFFPKESSFITLDDITPAFEMGDYVAFTLKKDFERRTEIKDYDPVVMYVKRTDEEPDYWFDRAHVAETLAPMSIWEIKDEERGSWMDWFKRAFSLPQFFRMFTDYADVLDSVALSDKEQPNLFWQERHLIPDRKMTQVNSIDDAFICLDVIQDEQSDSAWIARNLYDMVVENKTVPSLVLCIRSEEENITNWMIRDAFEMGLDTFSDTIKKLNSAPFFIEEVKTCGLDDVERKILSFFVQHGFHRVYIEDIHCVDKDADNTIENYVRIVMHLRLFAMILGIKIFLTSSVDICS